MDTILIACICAAVLAVYVSSRPGVRRTGIYLPDFYVAGLLVYALGAGAMYAGGGYPGAHSVTLMAEFALFAGCLGAIIGLLLYERRYPVDYIQNSLVRWRFGTGEEFAIYAGLLISALICTLFSVEVLRNNELSSLLFDAFSMSANDPGTFLEARKSITNGTEGYLAPGFVKEFRDVLIPILLSTTILVATRARLSWIHKAIVFGTCAAALIAMLLAGVRSSIFLFFITLFVARALAQRVHHPGKRLTAVRRKRRSRRQVLFVFIAIIAYGVLTILLGRLQDEGGLTTLSLNVIANLFDRIVMAAPRENIMSYAFWYSLGPAYGHYWLADLRGIVPGAGQVQLSNLLHQYNGGSILGNSSLGLAADVWLNWGWPGLLVIPTFYGLFLVYFDSALARLRSPVAFGVKVVLALALVKIYTPFGFVLYGGLPSILIYLGLRMLHGPERSPKRVAVPRYRASAFASDSQ